MCILSISTITEAAEPLPLQGSSFKALQNSFYLAIPNAKNSSLISTNNTLIFIKQRTDSNKQSHIRMQQHYAGYPVFGGYAIFHGNESAKTLLMSNDDVNMTGKIYKGLDNELGKPNSSFLSNAPLALAQFKKQFNQNKLSEEKVTPMVYISEDNKAFWAYKVTVMVHYDNKIPERPTAIIDASTYAPFIQWNDIKTMGKKKRLVTRVRGEGYGGNEVTSQFHFGSGLPYLEINRDEVKGICYMENEGVKIVDMQHRYQRANVAMQFNCNTSSSSYWTGRNGDGLDLDNGAYSPTNDALYAGYIINRMYSKWYGIPALTENDKPMQLIMRVHYGKGYENAFWDGTQMTFGDGDRMMYPLVSLGVGAHEISHGFTEQHSNLVYYGQSGGMNEAFSDMAAQAAEYYSKRSSSWKIGAEIMKKGSGYEALRYMNKPSLDGASIDTADDYYRGLDVHYSSGVYNRFFYILAHKPNWNTHKAFNVVVKANMDYWTPYSTFNEGACGIIQAASDLELSVDAVKQSLDDVAVKYEACGDIIPRSHPAA